MERNGITELVFILDRSGSMAGLEADTIGGFNALIEKQRRQPGRAYVTTVLFNTGFKTVHDRARLEDVRPMTDSDYCVGGCTALMDAIGFTIRHIAGIHRYARPEDVPEHTLFVITTDGMENASRHFSADQVREMIAHEKQKYGWEFLFLAANIDAAQTAAHMGIGADRAVDYRADGQGTRVLYDTVANAVSRVRGGAPLAADWSAAIEKDNRR